jgi:lactate permease
MHWTQINDPFNNIWLSILAALVPILFIFWALLIKKMKGYAASIIATGIALLIATAIYRMPVTLGVLSTSCGIVYGLFPICWLIITALFLFNITVESGQFEVIKHFMASVTSDR